MTNTKCIDVTLYALSSDLASDLTRALAPVCRDISTVNDLPRGAKVVFCPSNLNDVTRLRAAEPLASIIVVSRLPEINDWLDSIEAGADDYCAAPFETSQLQWILQTSQKLSSQLAA